MDLRVNLQRPIARIAAAILGAAVCLLLAFIVLTGFVKGVLGDDRTYPRPEALEAFLRISPDSALIQGRLAQAELETADPDVRAAETHAEAAVRLSPSNFGYWQTLASAQEALGNRSGAERSLAAALNLAPNNAEVKWQEGNVLLRDGRLNEASSRFREVCRQRPSLLPAALDTVWHESLGNAGAILRVTPPEPAAMLEAARFLLSHSRNAEAAGILEGIPTADIATLPTASGFIDDVIQSGDFAEAKKLWTRLAQGGVVNGSSAEAGGGSARTEEPLVWNGGFEADLVKGLPQFDWQLRATRFAVIKFDKATAHSGQRSLRIDFAGLDTTALNQEIRQKVVLKPGAAYKLTCFAKTLGLVTPEGPRIVVASVDGNGNDNEVIAESDPIKAGTADWSEIEMRFAAPAVAPGDKARDTVLLSVSLKRKPRYSYDDPTSGTVWLDDFNLTESASR